MKRIMNILVAVVTCFCVLAATVLPAYATSVEPDSVVEFLDQNGDVAFTVPEDEFDIDDYAIPYEVFYSNERPVTYTAEGLLGFIDGLAWSSEYAEAGYAIAEGGIYALGYLLAAGALVYAADGIYEVLRYDVPEVYVDTVSLIYMNLDAEGQAWMAEAFDLIVEGEPVTIPVSVSEQVAAALNGSIVTDGYGNVIDTSMSIPAEYVGGILLDAYPSTLKITTDLRLFGVASKTESNPSITVENDILSWTSTESIVNSETWKGINTLTNKVTGTTLTFNLNSVLGFPDLVKRMSTFYEVTFEDGSSFWMTYFSDSAVGSNGKPFTPASVTAQYPITITGSGTVLDGLTIVSVVWSAVHDAWVYTSADEDVYIITIDPLALLLSKTGTKTSGGKKPVDPNDDDKEVKLPWFPMLPDSTKPSVGVPVVDDLLDSAQSNIKDVNDSTDRTPPDESPPDLSTPTGIQNFVGNIGPYFDGLFDWLPDDFRDTLDGVLISLQTIMLLMVVVKIVDIIWP